MALKPFNSVGGFSVGEVPGNVILANGDITTTNITTTGVANLNSISNVKISGGTAGQVLSTDGAGNLTFVTLGTASLNNGTSNITILDSANINMSAAGNANVFVVTGTGANVSGTFGVTGNVSALGIKTDNIYYANGTPWDLQEAAGSNHQIQYNINNNFAASANFTYNDSTQLFTVAGNAQFNNANLGNLATANFVSGTLTTAAQPNITSVGTLSSLAVTANVTAGNVYANSGTIGAQTLKGEGGNISNIQGANVSGTVSSATTATTAGTVTTAAQPNITSVGTLTGLSVNGNITAANITANTGVFTGNAAGLTNIPGANVTGEVAFAATANSVAGANVSGQVANALVAGTVYTAAQPNITSVGTLTSLAVTGNASAGNLSTGGTLSVTGNANVGNIGATNGVFTTVAGTLSTAAQPNITSVGTLSSLSVTGNANVGNIGANNAVFTGTGSFGGNVAMGNFNITNLATPVNASDAATKEYVDAVAEGLNVHEAAVAATTGTLATESGGTVTYNNGTAGLGATLTTTGSYTTIDGVTLVNGDRILVKNETNAAHNGIYVRTSSTVLTRASDYNTTTEIKPGDFLFITGGTTYDNTGWVQTDTVTTIGTDPINFTQFSGAGTYTAGTGLTLTGTTFSVNASQTQITSVGTLTGLNVNGNIVAANITANTGVFTGNGAGLTNIAGANVTGQVGNALVAGTVYTNAQPNITSVGTLTSLSVTGNVTSGNVYANSGTVGATTGTFSGNVTAGNVYANSGTVGASTGEFTTGNITTINSGLMQNGTSNVAIVNNGNVTLGVAGTTRITATSVGANVTGTLGVSGNLTAGNISATTANLTTANVTGNVIVGSSTLTAASVTTTATTADQTIASFPVSGVTGVEFLVKGVDSSGSKYSVAKVVAVTNGTTVDYTVFGTVNIGTSTGSNLQVAVSSGNLVLQVTPSSSNSTVWTTQYSLV